MTPKEPIMICFIPSKERKSTKTYKLFEDVGIEFWKIRNQKQK
jgi:hypothetical protein